MSSRYVHDFPHFPNILGSTAAICGEFVCHFGIGVGKEKKRSEIDPISRVFEKKAFFRVPSKAVSSLRFLPALDQVRFRSTVLIKPRISLGSPQTRRESGEREDVEKLQKIRRKINKK